AISADHTETSSGENGESGNKAEEQATSPTCTRQSTDEESQRPQPGCITWTQLPSPNHH
ncbi:Hypothetical predicted protein, partial [Pelobates cultripes]